MTTKRFICLANSRKLNGRCVAGVEIVAGKAVGWIRPVSGSGHGEISESDRRYKDGGDPALRDVIDAVFKTAQPDSHQQENWLIDDHFIGYVRVGSGELNSPPSSHRQDRYGVWAARRTTARTTSLRLQRRRPLERRWR